MSLHLVPISRKVLYLEFPTKRGVTLEIIQHQSFITAAATQKLPAAK